MFIITGGGSGIGSAVAMGLAMRGFSVLVVGRREHLLAETASTSPLIEYLVADITTASGQDLLVHRAQQASVIHALVNNAGTLLPVGPLKDNSTSAWHESMKINLDAALILPQKLYPQLINKRVLNISSGAAYHAFKGWAAYCVSKAALSMLTRCWQLEVDEVAFASVLPGIVDTDMQAMARVGDQMDTAQVEFYRQLKESSRLVSASTVAAFLIWLLVDVDTSTYTSKEWNIYDTQHHSAWLKPPHQVIHWDC